MLDNRVIYHDSTLVFKTASYEQHTPSTGNQQAGQGLTQAGKYLAHLKLSN
jgi:hypothetical protein